MTHIIPPRPSRLAGRLPDFLIIGTAKGGTTALCHYLRQHPQVAMSREKELNFFFDGGVLPDDPRGFERGAWHLGVEWYRRWFQTDRPVCGEASPTYSFGAHAERIAGRIAAVVPRARLIYLVRNPLERARSYFRMVLRRPGATRLTFSEFLASSIGVETSCYGTILAAYRRHFPAEQILVLESAALDARRHESLATVFRFLGIEDRYRCRQFERRVFVGSRRPFVSPCGARVRDSAAVKFLRGRMPESVFYHVENLLLRPFSVAEPPVDLPPQQAAEMVARLESDMNLLRDLTGQRLPSLDVTFAQATSSTPDRFAMTSASPGGSRLPAGTSAADNA